MPNESPSIQVPKINGEKTLKLTDTLNIRNRELEIQKDAQFIYVPLTRRPSEAELSMLKTQLPDFQLGTLVFAGRKHRQKTLTETLENQLPKNLLNNLPRALDTIGDIAIVEIPAELAAYASLIGEAILKTHKNLRTVLAKAGAVSGTYRLRELAVIAGEPKTATVHKEHGCRYQVDVAKAYFSPRLSHEHLRVASLVQNSETVVDLFAGVGPFAVLVAKNNPAAKVYAVDINPDAVELLQKNIRLNRVENRVFPILGDARQIVQDKLPWAADRVIMNLPEKAHEFVDAACKAVKPTGGTVHFYCFIRLPDSIENMQKRFAAKVAETGRTVAKFLSARTIRETAPFEWQVVLDAQVR
ncbi:MAG: class I SAM-dependent methyltransferase family protein [Candidatus Bathyarchaeota archaeon]|nr:class I SAM-dependent methyltransferase family protein [Candidatus Bathyarchaeota archaeon]